MYTTHYKEARFSSQLRNMKKGSFLALLSILALVASVSFESCYYDVEEELYSGVVCDTTVFTYTAKISSIISQNCLPCHDSSQLSGDIDLSSYTNLKDATSAGNVICSIRHEGSCSAMPQDAGQMDACSIRLIELWATNGYPEN